MLRKKFEQAKGIDGCRFVLNGSRTILSDNLKQALSRRDAVVCRLHDTFAPVRSGSLELRPMAVAQIERFEDVSLRSSSAMSAPFSVRLSEQHDAEAAVITDPG
jgi:hypothetical protein